MLSLSCKDSNGRQRNKECKELKAGPRKCKHIIPVYILPDVCASMMAM
jgi:hypothetical protein